MKVWIYTILGLAAFIIFGFITQSYLNKSAAQLNTPLQQAENALRSQKWRETTAQLRQVAQKWDKTKSIWAVFLHHNEIDTIEQSLIKSKEAVHCRDYTESVVELGNLQYFINHVPKREELSLVNIF